MSKGKTEVQFTNTANPNKFVKRANGTIDKSKAYTSNIRIVAVGDGTYQHPEELSKGQVKKMVDIRTKEAKEQGLPRVLFTADVDNTYYRDNRSKQVNTSEDGVSISYVYKTNVRPTQMGITL
jgi:predicted acetyltransferase